MKKIPIPYECISCGYTVTHKPSMRKHLYKLKQCPKDLNDIVLTDAIKETILADHKYRMPPPPPPVINNVNNIINYNNTIVNLVNNMDVRSKIEKYIEHHDIQLIECGDTIEKKFSKQIKELQKDNNDLGADDNLILDRKMLLNVIDNVSSLAHEYCQNMNMIYEKKFEKLQLFDTGKWEELILVNGIGSLLAKIQEHYFDAYECYLIRKIEMSSLGGQSKASIKEQLIEYYKFIGCFGIAPYVKDRNETLIIYSQEDDRYNSEIEMTDENCELPQKYLNLYIRVVDETKMSELNKIKKNIADIIKKNCLKNVDELNKKVVALFNMDEEFKQTILPKSIC